MEGSDLMTMVRNDCSVELAGSDDKNRDIWGSVSCFAQASSTEISGAQLKYLQEV